jgi:hypothetical protein
MSNDIKTIEEGIPPKKVITEDLGKIFEMAICLLYNIPYKGKYKYTIEAAEKLKDRILPFKHMFRYNIHHTAIRGAQYDFTCIEDETVHLSAKTTKKGDKVCPQVIGQPSKKKFCQHFNVDIALSLNDIKGYIQENIHSMLDRYFECTFDCAILYFNQHRNITLFVKKRENIRWNDYVVQFSHILNGKEWNESSTISIGGESIGEFQVHNHRDNIKFRWCFEKLLQKFKEHFEITPIVNNLETHLPNLII